MLVFMLAYGVGRDVILNPETNRSLSTFAERLLVPYFQMYGELFMDYPQQSSKLSNTFDKYPHFDHWFLRSYFHLFSQ